MAENRYSAGGLPSQGCRETVCIDTNRVLDSCRDRDCFENARVYLSDFGNEVLNHTGAVRIKSADILWTNISMDSIQFNRGFYTITIRFFVRVLCEACVGGGHSQTLQGIAVLEKRVILYGGESNASIYKSIGAGSFCTGNQPNFGAPNLPTAVVEVVDPVILGSKIMEKESDCSCCCCCKEEDLPIAVTESLEAPLNFADDGANRYLTVSLGIFSVVRMLRPAQLLVQANDYTVPEKQCVSAEVDDPCQVFRAMPFPTTEFNSQSNSISERGSDRHCGCN